MDGCPEFGGAGRRWAGRDSAPHIILISIIIYLHEHRPSLRPGGMEAPLSATVDVLAVIGTCTEHRRGYAERLAQDTGCMLLSAGRIAAGVDPLDDAVSLAPRGWRDGGTIVELPAAIPVQDAVAAFAGNP